MLYLNDIKVEFESQGFKGTHIGISPDKDKSVLFLESVRSTQTVRCPYCGDGVYIYGLYTKCWGKERAYKINLKNFQKK